VPAPLAWTGFEYLVKPLYQRGFTLGGSENPSSSALSFIFHDSGV
jgi:hypothetical protein